MVVLAGGSNGCLMHIAVQLLDVAASLTDVTTNISTSGRISIGIATLIGAVR